MDLDSDHTYFEQRGESLVDLLQEEAGIDVEAAEDVADLLIENDPFDPRDGEGPFYSAEEQYERLDVSEGEYGELWEEFSQRIQHEIRFFDRGAQALLADILGKPESRFAGGLPSLELGPGSRVASVFRARRADTAALATHLLANPINELARPPVHLARAGRMNASGIPVFYGALSAATAIAEVRPYVGSIVITARFSILRQVRVLDLSRIDQFFTGSIFAPQYEKRASRLRFLQRFHHLIARPVQPGDEALEFVPTQAVAEYVHNVLGFDGMLYMSAQLGGPPLPDPDERRYITVGELSDEDIKEYNLVLFGAAGATVGAEDRPDPGLELDRSMIGTERITGVRYSHEWTYVPDLDAPTIPGDEGAF